jgi:hypothetical protein
MMLVFNGIMLLSGSSTIDSTFSSVAKLVARDWRNDVREPAARHLTAGRIAVLVVAVIGNLPLLIIYLGDKVGPAIIAATTISGTMVMGLAPVFLLSWLRPAGRLSFHLAFWPGLVFGVLRTVEVFFKIHNLPRGDHARLREIRRGPRCQRLGASDLHRRLHSRSGSCPETATRPRCNLTTRGEPANGDELQPRDGSGMVANTGQYCQAKHYRSGGPGRSSRMEPADGGGTGW